MKLIKLSLINNVGIYNSHYSLFKITIFSKLNAIFSANLIRRILLRDILCYVSIIV
jgi:hypothetical protein